MCGSMVDIQFTAAEIRRGKKERRRRNIEIAGQKCNGLPYYIGRPKLSIKSLEVGWHYPKLDRPIVCRYLHSISLDIYHLKNKMIILKSLWACVLNISACKYVSK